MNQQIMLMSMIAAASVVFIGILAYRITTRHSDPAYTSLAPLVDNSTLEEDFKDILAFVPLDEVKNIIKRYMEYDAQVGETVSFISDQKRFIVRELQKMPQMTRLINFLEQNGLQTGMWYRKIRLFWKSSPRFTGYRTNATSGGLTVMINNIMKTIPLDELHELLRQKVKYSGSFRRFLLMLRSKNFRELCTAMEENEVLHHHYFWAKESGIEITFAIELYGELYTYLTQTLVA